MSSKRLIYFRCPACRKVHTLRVKKHGEYEEKHTSMELAVAMTLRKKIANVFCTCCSVLSPARRHALAWESLGEFGEC